MITAHHKKVSNDTIQIQINDYIQQQFMILAIIEYFVSFDFDMFL